MKTTNKRYNSLYESYWNKYSSLANETEISMYKETYEKYIVVLVNMINLIVKMLIMLILMKKIILY